MISVKHPIAFPVAVSELVMFPPSAKDPQD
jgi:hypothetical protein